VARRRRPPRRPLADAAPKGVHRSVELRAVKLIGGGRTLAHFDDATWMLDGALPDEVVIAVADRRRARIIEATATEVVDNPHPARLSRPCPHSGSCGGCDWPHVDSRSGSVLKIDVAAEAAARFPSIATRIRDAAVTPSRASYRLRDRLHWDPVHRTLGFYGRRSRRVAEIAECRIISPTLSTLLPILTAALGESCEQLADVEILEGADVMVAALLPARGGPGRTDGAWLPPAETCPGLAGFHRLDRAARLIRGWGRDRVRMELPVELEVPIGSFFQGNRHLIRPLFDRVSELIGPGDGPVFDLHGGVGFLAAAAAWAGRQALTVVEVHPGAAAAARANLPTAEVSSTTAEDFVFRHRSLPTESVVITDPPRSGMSRELRSGVVDWRPEKIVMLGCDPATWSRDAAALVDHGYRLAHIELFDLFPFTHHVEIVAVMETE
jgi:23S rRNA (uracil1939-C5)-methyltransferase